MRIVVTGGSGFLGSHIADTLSDAGHQVTIFDRAPSRWLRPDQVMMTGTVLDAGMVRADSTPAVFGVSGYTGGGKELIAVHEQPGVEPFGLYGLELTHKHVPEMKKYSGLAHAPLFVPSVGHYAQGMLVTVPITRDITTKQLSAKDVHNALADYYAGEKFVTVRPLADRKWLERDRFLRADRLIDTNSMELAVYGNEAEGTVLAVASLDNLGKGASGAAVQTINLKTGVDETTGLAVA